MAAFLFESSGIPEASFTARESIWRTIDDVPILPYLLTGENAIARLLQVPEQDWTGGCHRGYCGHTGRVRQSRIERL